MTSFLHFASLLLTRWYSFLWLVQRLAVFLEENMVSEYTLALIPLACPKASTASIGVMKGHRVAQLWRKKILRDARRNSLIVQDQIRKRSSISRRCAITGSQFSSTTTHIYLFEASTVCSLNLGLGIPRLH
jgi:hypothetical protein